MAPQSTRRIKDGRVLMVGVLGVDERDANDPFSLLRKWDATLGEFDGFFEGLALRNPGSPISPACDVQETEKGFVFSLDLPGVRKESLSVCVVQGQLTVLGDKAGGGFRWLCGLPETADSDRIRAGFESGSSVLRVVVPKFGSVDTELARQCRVERPSGWAVGI